MTWYSNTIEYFELDLDIYEGIFKKSPRLIKKEKESKSIIKTIEKLNEDIYLALFKAKPIFTEEANIDINYSFNSMIMKKTFEVDDIDLFRGKTSLNYFSSILGAEILSDEIVKNYKKLIENNKSFETLVRAYENDISTYNETKDKTKEKRMKDNIRDSIDLIAKAISKNNVIYESVALAYKEFLSITNTVKFWGLDDGKINHTSYDEKVIIARKLITFKKIKKLSQMVGRFKASASSLQKKKTKEQGQEIYGVELGNEIHKIIPSEKLFLANEKTKRNFYKKYYQKELLSYKYKNSKIKSKGPIICCIDTSQSMEGDREIWSKSVAMALLDIAYKQKRDFVSILFSYKIGQVIDFNKNKVEADKIYQLATSFYGSGTNFIEPLTETLKLVNKSKYKYADVVFITDGKAPINDDFIDYFNEEKKKRDFRFITVNVADKIEEGLDRINDVQILLTDLSDEKVEETNRVIFSI